MRAVSVIQGPATLLEVIATDALTGAPLPHAQVQFEARPRRGDWAELPFPVKSVGGGVFAAAAGPQALRAALHLGVNTTFRVTVRCRGCTELSDRLRLLASDMQMVERTADIGGQSVTRHVLAGAPLRVEAPLSPPAVRLAGIVVRNGDLTDVVPGADVTLDGDAASTVQTDAEGRFLFEGVPVQRTVRVAATAGADAATRTHQLDYRQPTNRVMLNMNTQPSN